MAGTGANQANPTEPVELAEPVTVDGSIDVGNPCSDIELVLLTDEGTDPDTDFLRTYEYDCAGDLVGFTDTLLDGSTGYAPIGPIVVTVQAAATRDIEQEILCDDQGGGTIVPFVRRYRYNTNGTFQSFLNLTLAGAAYVPLGAVIRCSAVTVASLPLPAGAATNASQRDDEFQVLCDSTPTAFLRRYRTDPAGVVTITNTTLDGTTAFAPVGAIGSCSDSIASFPSDREVVVLCDTVTSFLRRYNVTSAGVVTATDTTLNGVTPYVTVGAVAVCPTGATCDDVELLELTDCIGVPFLRRIEYACNGTVSAVVDTTLNGSTPYVACAPVHFVAGGGTQSGAGGPAIVTRVTDAANYVTSALARRVTIIWTGNANAVLNRVALKINAGPFVPLVNQAGTIIFGDLASADSMGFTITIDVNQASDDVTVVEEF